MKNSPIAPSVVESRHSKRTNRGKDMSALRKKKKGNFKIIWI